MRSVEEVFSNSDLVGEIIKNGIEKTSSLIKACSEARSLSIKLGKRLSNERIRSLAIEALGFKTTKKISPVIVHDGFFELSYMSRRSGVEYYFWNEFILLVEPGLIMTIYNEKGEVLIRQESFNAWVSSENYLVLYFGASLSLYTHMSGKVVKILEKQVLPSFFLLLQLEVVEVKSGGLIILASFQGSCLVFKFEDGLLKEFLKGEYDGEIVIFYPSGELHLESQVINGLGYEGIYIGANIYHYDSNKITIHDLQLTFGFSVFVWRTLELIIFFKGGCALINGEDRKLLWCGNEGLDEYKMFYPPFIISGENIYDLETRKKLLNLTPFLKINGENVASIIDGFSLKRDGTGYFIWISPKVLSHELQEVSYLHRGETILRMKPILFEN